MYKSSKNYEELRGAIEKELYAIYAAPEVCAAMIDRGCSDEELAAVDDNVEAAKWELAEGVLELCEWLNAEPANELEMIEKMLEDHNEMWFSRHTINHVVYGDEE